MTDTSLIEKYEVHAVTGGTDDSMTVDQVERSYFVTPRGVHGTTTVEEVTGRRDSLREQWAANGQCETWADRCMNSIIICIGCGGLCISVPVTNIPGVIACVTCVMGCHFTVPLSCGKVVQNCG